MSSLGSYPAEGLPRIWGQLVGLGEVAIKEALVLEPVLPEFHLF